MNNEDLLKQLPNAPQWALWAGKGGGLLIDFGIALFAVSVVLWLLQAKRPKLTRPASLTFISGCCCLLGAMACLVSLFVTDQFEYRYIFSHGDALTDIKYKIAGVWTAQEGSFLLWACTSAIFGLLAYRGTGPFRRWYAITFSVFLACLCGILAYETPFDLIPFSILNGVVKLPMHGSGMTPSLQNYWVVIHPPTIFMGFGSLTVMFAMSIAGMFTGNIDWVKVVRPWTLLSASILGLGLCMGGMWAYETLGWGGFWAWDPVENVSFVPWLFTAAFIHGIIVQVTKKRWIGTNLLLGGMPFLTFVYGTFLTRSGLLDKVSNHSFASMNRSALIVLKVFLVAITVAFFVLYGMKGRKLSKLAVADEEPGFVDREKVYRFGVLLLSLLAVGIAIGMSWPWFTAIRDGEGAALEEIQYHPVVVWFFIPILLLMAIGPFVSWRAMGLKSLFNRIVSVLSVTAGVTGFALVIIQNPTIGVHMIPGSTVRMPKGYLMALMPWMAILIFVCVFTVVANLWRIAELVKRAKLTLGGFVAHIGVATLMAGLIVSRGFEQKDTVSVDPALGASSILGYKIEYKDWVKKSLQDRDGKITFGITTPDGKAFDASLNLYYYQGEEGVQKAMVWPFIDKHFSHDFYMAMAEPDIYAWLKPVKFKEGETQVVPVGESTMTVTYQKFVRKGNVGAAGTTFGAQVHLLIDNQTYDVTPSLEISGDGPPKRNMPPVGVIFRLGMLEMDPSDRSVSLQLFYSPPLYHIVLYYKPMTILVWLGTGILTLGGLMSAFARRARKNQAPEPTPSE